MKKFILLCLSFFFALGTNASHIIGGYITYRCLGNNNYEITLVVYRDCYNGVPLLDNPAHLGLFDLNNNIFLYKNDSITTNDTLFTPGDCIPTNICFQRGTYVDTVNIPPSKFPVTVSYQRCCRSSLIQNILNPTNFGMTFWTTISAVDSNPAFFSHEVPGFTYVNDNFVYNASAYDGDGDSLVYSLTDFYDGASPSNDQPPPIPPPYSLNAWQPPYSVADVIGSNPPLAIDPATGIMTAVPSSSGVFQIAEKVDSYRNGVWINNARREFLLFINPANYYNFSGNVSVNVNTQTLDAGKSWLIRKNLYDSTLTATDTNNVITGAYSFSNTINGKYLVKASADAASPYYPNNIPTYLGDVLFWYQATELNLCNGNAQNVNINLVQGINPGGPGFIGGFITQGANKMLGVGDPLIGVTVILFNVLNQPVAYSVTDATGYFSISNLPLGTYKVYIDKLNAMIDNSIAPSITLTAGNPGSNILPFTLYSDHLVLNGFVNVIENNGNENLVSVIPNPAKGNASLKYFLNDRTNIIIDVYDLYGRKTKTIFQGNQIKGEHTYQLDFKKENMKSGIYLIVLKSGDFSKTIRITVM
jgi:hypothetical protein